ncbi:MAG: hypothetical protein N3B13_09370, partial [Deltaproteobacteria bacterium]|nr:hypothetical protein [Deltaproteobacteria bacterium]
ENAMCVADPVTPCDETFNSFCIDNILYSCAFTSVEKKGYVAGTDCSQIKTYDASASLQCIEDKETGSRCR